MSIFRREKNSLEEYRRSRRALSRVHDDEDGEEEPEAAATPPSYPGSPSLVDSPELLSPPDPPAGAPAAPQADVTPQPGPARPQINPESYRQGATTVGKDTSFNGTLKSEGNLYIEGNFDGELEARSTIFIAGGARVKASVRAADVIIAGTFDGAADASARFHAMPTARVTGEINTAILVVEQGSQINCRFAMKPRGEEKA